MGVIVRADTAIIYPLPSRCLVGRSSLAELRLLEKQVSGEHAVVYFHDQRWKVRDLGSLNGTLVNGARVAEGSGRTLLKGDVLSFGGGASGQVWGFVSDAPPGPAASGPDGNLLETCEKTLWLPDWSAPEASVFWSDGGWVLTGPDGPQRVEDGALIQVAGRMWVLHLPRIQWDQDTPTGTTRSGGSEGIRMEFSVSLDLEHVDLTVVGDGVLVKIGARSFNMALLTLALRCIEDEAASIPTEEVGWMYTEELRKELGLEREGLNLQLWRAMQAFGKAGLPGGQLIERRLDSGQLRVGLPCFVRFPKALSSLHQKR